MPPSVSNPHPTVLFALASVAVSLGAVPLHWTGNSHFGLVHHCLFVAQTIIAVLLVAVAIRSMFLVRWQDRTHPSVLMGACAIAIGMTAVPLHCTGHMHEGSRHPGFFIAITVLAMLFASSSATAALGRMAPDRPRRRRSREK